MTNRINDYDSIVTCTWNFRMICQSSYLTVVPITNGKIQYNVTFSCNLAYKYLINNQIQGKLPIPGWWLRWACFRLSKCWRKKVTRSLASSHLFLLPLVCTCIFSAHCKLLLRSLQQLGYQHKDQRQTNMNYGTWYTVHQVASCQQAQTDEDTLQ